MSDVVRSGRLDGKTALITGAASGLGFAIAKRFLDEGAKVVLTDRDGDAVAARAVALGAMAAGLRLDVTSELDWLDAFRRTSDLFGGLHLLVNNAGICAPGTIEDASLDEWRLTHSINLDGVFLGCKHALPLIVSTVSADGKCGSILNISSVSAMIAAANLASYNSSKAAVRHLTKSVALHCARSKYPISCNSVHPTFIDTPLLDALSDRGDRQALLQKLARQIPIGRVGEPDDVAWAAVYLCSDEARFVTGAELAIDGGVSAG